MHVAKFSFMQIYDGYLLSNFTSDSKWRTSIIFSSSSCIFSGISMHYAHGVMFVTCFLLIFLLNPCWKSVRIVNLFFTHLMLLISDMFFAWNFHLSLISIKLVTTSTLIFCERKSTIFSIRLNIIRSSYYFPWEDFATHL